MGLLMALLLAGFLESEPPAVEKYDPWLDASNDGSVLATAQVCEFDEAELRQVVDALEQAAIQRATENGVSLDNATYRVVEEMEWRLKSGWFDMGRVPPMPACPRMTRRRYR